MSKEKAEKPKTAKPQKQAQLGEEKKPKKEKAAKPAADAAAEKEAPKEEKPKAPPRPPADPRLKVLKKFHGKFLPRGPLARPPQGTDDTLGVRRRSRRGDRRRAQVFVRRLEGRPNEASSQGRCPGLSAVVLDRVGSCRAGPCTRSQKIAAQTGRPPWRLLGPRIG